MYKRQQQCFPTEEAATRAAFSQRLAVFPEHFWIAEENGEIVACVNGCVSDAPLLQDEMFEDTGLHNEQGAWQMLFGVETHPVVQVKGYASALMRQMIEDARAQGRRGEMCIRDRYLPVRQFFVYQRICGNMGSD